MVESHHFELSSSNVVFLMYKPPRLGLLWLWGCSFLLCFFVSEFVHLRVSFLFIPMQAFVYFYLQQQQQLAQTGTNMTVNLCKKKKKGFPLGASLPYRPQLLLLLLLLLLLMSTAYGSRPGLRVCMEWDFMALTGIVLYGISVLKHCMVIPLALGTAPCIT